MRTCDRCGERLSETTEPTGVVCDRCALTWFKAQVAHSEQFEKELLIKMRPGWSAKAFNTADMDGDDMFHVDVRTGKDKLGISISIEKSDDDNFTIWVGDKRLTVMAEPVNDDNVDGTLGVVTGGQGADQGGR